jgi:uncharacterized membrane-anchored protein
LAIALFLCTKSAFADDLPVGITWQKGPLTASLGGVAEIQVPKGYKFTDAAGTRRLLELNQNPTSGDEVGLMMPVLDPGSKSQDWFMLFEFHETGYITDEEKGSLDSSAILSSIQKATESANEIRKQKGWGAFHVTGWSKEPFYDERTHNLTWAVLGHDDSPQSGSTVNYSVRLLGRKGTMSVDLVLSPEQLPAVVPEFDQLMQNFTYTNGNRYAEFMKGDKVAGYGLTALVAGGAAAAAVKTGLFAKLFKILATAAVAFWKVILVFFAAVAARLKSIAKWLKSFFVTEKPAYEASSDQTPLLTEPIKSSDHDAH